MSRSLFLSIVCCCWLVSGTTAAKTVATTTSREAEAPVGDASTSANNNLFSYVCDDGLLRGFDHRLDNLATQLEIIRSKADLQQLRLEQQEEARERRLESSIQKLVAGVGSVATEVQNLTASQMQKWLEHQTSTVDVRIDRPGSGIGAIAQIAQETHGLKDDIGKIAAETTQMAAAVQQLAAELREAQNETRSSVAEMQTLAREMRDVLQTQQHSRQQDDEEERKKVVHRTPAPLPATCAEAVGTTGRSGIHRLQPDPRQPAFFAPCLADEAGGAAWTLVQRRQDGSIDFYRNWTEYQVGFGNLAREFFIGLDRLHALTHATLHELCVQMEDFEGAKRHACYDAFAVGDASRAYTLELLGKFSGDAGDSLTGHQGQKFTTKDVHNDDNSSNCAVAYRGAWWYKKCHTSNLNGLYLRGEYPKEKYAQGVVWNSWRGFYYSLKYVHMAIRPRS